MIAYIIIGVIGLFIVLTIYEYIHNMSIEPLPARPSAADSTDGFDKIMNSDIHKLISKLEAGQPLSQEDYEDIEYTCQYLDKRYDCSDFRMQTILRILYQYPDQIRKDLVQRMKMTLLGSKFFMDQPGDDSLCLWSENHLLLFAAAEYLTGQLYEEDRFTNDSLTGSDHMKLAKERLNIWFQQKFDFGFIEWYSNTYYEEDMGPLANLIDFCHDPDIVAKATMAMDLLLFDMASQSYKGSFTSTSGRQYEKGKKSGSESALINVTEKVWSYPAESERKGLDQNFIYCKKYEVPQVIKAIGRDHEPRIIKASTGLNLKELVSQFPGGMDLDRVMMQWAVEAFTNEEVITDTMKYIHKHKMLTNEFLNDFKMIDLSMLKSLNILPLISRWLRPMTNGVAIQRANTYTYRTEDFMMATAQKYHPGDFGDQQHIWSATLPKGICVFTSHPAQPFTEDGALSASPGYWVGNGRNPHSVQDRSVNMTLYVIEEKKGLLEKDLLHESHMYFPIALMDEVVIKVRHIFGRINQTFIGVISKNALTFKDGENGQDLVQKGSATYWITELGSGAEESFTDFIDRILSSRVDYDEDTHVLRYWGRHRLEVEYQKDFLIDGQVEKLDYQRFDSDYAKAARKPKKVHIQHEGQELYLDFEALTREVTRHE